MLNKDLFKNTMKELLSIHGIEVNETPIDMPKLWYEELKGLKDEDFIIAASRVKFSPKLSLYYILINLPQYNKEKDKTIHEYCERLKNEEIKKKRIYVPIDPTM